MMFLSKKLIQGLGVGLCTIRGENKSSEVRLSHEEVLFGKGT